MGEGSGIVDIVIFAMIAAFLVYRLVSVLGRRTGNERPRVNPADSFVNPPAAGPVPQRHPYAVGPMASPAAPPAPPPFHDGPVSLEDGVRHIRSVDPTFDERTFLTGAQAAFTMILAAFAAGDLATLRRLLADAVYADFTRAIEERTRAGQTLEAHVERIDSADLAQARLVEGRALCTVRFVSHQTNITRAADGTVIEGQPGTVEEVTDLWTFARDTRAKDPNWQLVETRLG